MANYTESIEKLIESLTKLPGIGRRSAERVVSYILGATKEEVKNLSDGIVKVKESVRFCSLCHNLSEEELCKICQDPAGRRTLSVLLKSPAM